MLMATVPSGLQYVGFKPAIASSVHGSSAIASVVLDRVMWVCLMVKDLKYSMTKKLAGPASGDGQERRER